MFRRALICTDLSDGLQRLVHFVPSLVAGGLESIVFFTNVPLQTELEIPRVDAERVEAARQLLSVALQRLPEGAAVELEVQSGRISDNILKAARTHRADIIFMGMPTRTLLTEKLFGSTTMSIAKQTETPLMILRPQLVATYREGELALRCRDLFTYLLLPYDGSQSARHLIDRVKQYAQADADHQLRQCLLCWVIDDSIREELQVPDPVGHAEAELAAIQAELAAVNIAVTIEVRQGNPQEEILASAEVNDISAIAVCSGRSGFLAKWSVPSFTNALLRESWHPILYFPPARG
jgi:nucleotide-binding universal stress UspA family protein